MIKYLLVLLLITPCFNAYPQKIKFKLAFAEGKYSGKMNPHWFEEVNLTPPDGKEGNITGAEGIMEGGEFGSMDFSIAKNKTGTIDDLMIKTNNGWYPIEKLNISRRKLNIMFDWGFTAPPTPEDYKILVEAAELLETSDHWNSNDDRICEDDFNNQRWSLYCVLKQASINTFSDFNHRSAALNEVRNIIVVIRPDREYAHRLMDFNNEEEFSTVREVLSTAIKSMEKKLN